MNDPTRGSRGAFTLVELLVAMSVIAILVGILVVVLSSVRVTPRVAGTRNTIRQVGAALQRYSADWGVFPPDADTLKNDPPKPTSPELLYTYLCTPNLSVKHPYYEAQLDIQTCDFTFIADKDGDPPSRPPGPFDERLS